MQQESGGDLRFFTDVLEEGLREHYGRSVEIVDVQVRPLATSSHPIERLTVTLASGERIPVIFKRPQPGEKLYGNEREVLIYRSLLKGGRFGAPVLYASVYDSHRGAYGLFLEDLGNTTLDAGGMRSWTAAVRWLGEVHAAYLGREDELRALGCLMEHDAGYYAMVKHTARSNLELASAGDAIGRFDDLMRPFDALVAYLTRQPRTLVHGDMFADNIIIQPGRRIRAVDWESAAIGLGAWDLARLLDGWGSRGEPLRSAYLAELEQRVPGFARLEFDRVFADCKILNVLWHLRWSVDACQDAPFVESELDELEALWKDWSEERAMAEGLGCAP